MGMEKNVSRKYTNDLFTAIILELCYSVEIRTIDSIYSGHFILFYICKIVGVLLMYLLVFVAFDIYLFYFDM